MGGWHWQFVASVAQQQEVFGHIYNTGQTRPDRVRNVPIAVGIEIGVGVGIGIGIGIDKRWDLDKTVHEGQPQYTVGIDPDPDSDPDTDGNREQTDPRVAPATALPVAEGQEVFH
jgi:hypothetical protein